MKKTILTIALITSMLLICGCSQKQNTEEISGMPNPMVEYDSLDKINEIAETNIVAPGVMGKTNEKYFVISDKLAHYTFELNGQKWTIRGAKEINEDISGIHDQNNIFESKQNATIYLENCYIERFFVDDTQYVIILDNPNGFDEEAFSNICYELENNIKGMFDITGEYQDEYSQRATMSVTEDNGTYYFTVYWSNSSNETIVYSMEGTREDEDIKYEGENIAVYTYDDEGNEMVADGTASNNIGWFEIVDGKLAWTGASKEENKNCVFVKVSD